MTTVYGVLPEIKDYTPTTLFLLSEADGSAINGSGDAITKSGSYFSADVAEAIVQCVARIDDATGQIWTGWMSASGVLSSQRAAATPADVNAEVLDVLTTDTFAELAAVPAATSSLKDKLVYVFQWLRNKSTQTPTQRKLYADDGSTVVATETVSDDGTTYSKGEAS